jgi:hypothetical protein
MRCGCSSRLLRRSRVARSRGAGARPPGAERSGCFGRTVGRSWAGRRACVRLPWNHVRKRDWRNEPPDPRPGDSRRALHGAAGMPCPGPTPWAARLPLADGPERTGAIDGAVFGLLGLLIAFSFSGAAARFDKRRTQNRRGGQCHQNGLPPDRRAPPGQPARAARELSPVRRRAPRHLPSHSGRGRSPPGHRARHRALGRDLEAGAQPPARRALGAGRTPSSSRR